jgi:chemotaxis protein MotB
MRKIALILALASLGACVPKSKYDALETQYEDCKTDLHKREAMLKAWHEQQAALVADLKPLIDRGLLTVENVDGRLTVSMRAEVLFASGSADLSEAGLDTVTQLGKVLETRTDADWQVEGHTDNDPIATPQFPSNWHLGAARAINVTLAMIKAGMSPEHVSAATFGQFAPADSNATDAGKAANRRIEVVLLPDLSALPGFDRMMEGGVHRKTKPGGGPHPGGGEGQPHPHPH